MKRSLVEKRVIVTGASSGIGRELAKQLVSSQAQVLATARRETLLHALKQEVTSLGVGGPLYYLAGDITDADFRAQLVEYAVTLWGGFDILINNAGVGAMGRFADSSERVMRQVMEVNFFAPVELTRLALPHLLQGQSPIIVNIGSVLGHRAVPLKSEYCASKFALHGWSDALRAELAAAGVDVTMVSPSTTDSEFFEHAIQDQAKRNWKSGGATSVARVAAVIVRAIQRGTHDVILTLGGKSLVLLDRLAPTLADRAVERWGQ